jgi:hypothetical protein
VFLLVATDYPFLDVLWTIFIFFLWVIWIWFLIAILSDVFRRHDISGGKTPAAQPRRSRRQSSCSTAVQSPRTSTRR